MNWIDVMHFGIAVWAGAVTVRYLRERSLRQIAERHLEARRIEDALTAASRMGFLPRFDEWRRALPGYRKEVKPS